MLTKYLTCLLSVQVNNGHWVLYRCIICTGKLSLSTLQVHDLYRSQLKQTEEITLYLNILYSWFSFYEKILITVSVWSLFHVTWLFKWLARVFVMCSFWLVVWLVSNCHWTSIKAFVIETSDSPNCHGIYYMYLLTSQFYSQTDVVGFFFLGRCCLYIWE